MSWKQSRFWYVPAAIDLYHTLEIEVTTRVARKINGYLSSFVFGTVVITLLQYSSPAISSICKTLTEDIDWGITAQSEQREVNARITDGMCNGEFTVHLVKRSALRNASHEQTCGESFLLTAYISTTRMELAVSG